MQISQAKAQIWQDDSNFIGFFPSRHAHPSLCSHSFFVTLILRHSSHVTTFVMISLSAFTFCPLVTSSVPSALSLSHSYLLPPHCPLVTSLALSRSVLQTYLPSLALLPPPPPHAVFFLLHADERFLRCKLGPSQHTEHFSP